MPRRLVIGFALVSFLLMLLMGLARAFTVGNETRERDSAHVVDQAVALAGVVRARSEAGQRVDVEVLRSFLNATATVTYDVPGQAPLVVNGGLEDVTGGDNVITTEVPLYPGSLTFSEQEEGWIARLGLDTPSLVVLVLLLTCLAGLAGYVMARWLAAPFTRLATAAEMLGRGRFDLDLPQTRIPEARAVAAALESSAIALRDRLAREQQFSQHASHVLRTPLTSLRLHLDELDQQDLDADARGATERCLDSVERLEQVAADLVDISRRGTLMSGAEISVRELATAAAQQWADVLVGGGRDFSAAVEGDVSVMVTPGPIEYVLDVLLEQAQRGGGEGGGQGGGDHDQVRLVVHGGTDVLRVEVSGLPAAAAALLGSAGSAGSADPARGGLGPAPDARLEQARSFTASMGGRLEPLPDRSGVRVLVPPR